MNKKYYKKGEINIMDLKTRIRAFLCDTGAPVTAFCRKVEMSPSYYYQFMNGEAELSQALINNITNYLDEVYAK